MKLLTVNLDKQIKKDAKSVFYYFNFTYNRIHAVIWDMIHLLHFGSVLLRSLFTPYPPNALPLRSWGSG